MKKNKTMRAAALMLALTLITTCFVGSTFAKYTTKGSASDNARVAKFGVEVAVDAPDAFATEYATDDDDFSGKLSVKSSDEAKLVAPGTSSEDLEDGQFKFSIKGTPEVAVKVSIEVDDSTKDVFLAKGSYLDWTNAPYTEEYVLTDDYYPIVWKLTVNDQNPAGTDVIEEGTLDEVVSAVEEYVRVASYDPNTKLDAEFTLDWAWAFEQQMDEADTLLGNIAADAKYAKNYVGTALEKGTDYNVNPTFGFTVTVEQIN